MKKLDIMKNTGQNWVLAGDKVQRVEEVIVEPVIVEKKVKEELKEKVNEIKKLKEIKEDDEKNKSRIKTSKRKSRNKW